jgi:hypothetical protein
MPAASPAENNDKLSANCARALLLGGVVKALIENPLMMLV